MDIPHSTFRNAQTAARSPRVKSKRGAKACSSCHGRKVRCDVSRRGIPCSNCLDQSFNCVVKQRKNARIISSLEEQLISASQVIHGYNGNDNDSDNASKRPWTDHSGFPTAPLTENLLPSMELEAQQTAPAHVEDIGDQSAHAIANPQGQDSSWPPSNGIDLSSMPGLEDAFAFADWTLLSPATMSGPNRQIRNEPWNLPNLVVQTGTGTPQQGRELYHGGLTTAVVSGPADRQFLRDQGCFTLPPFHLLRKIIRSYLQFIQPNLPVVDAYRFESILNDHDLNLDGFSFALFRAMLFAAAHFLEKDEVCVLGYAEKHELRVAYYRQTKLLLDLGLETDPLINAQACLLLTYYAPSYDILRVNTFWLVRAAHFARIAGADKFHLLPDGYRTKQLKRVWWGVLFRDRILSLGLRRKTTVQMDRVLDEEKFQLNVEDFEADLGHSIVHDRATQLRITEIAVSTCSLVSKVTPALDLLYHYESAGDRIRTVGGSIPNLVADIQHCIDGLETWYISTMQKFPDRSDESVCIFANMLFCYHSSAVFALNLLRVLLHETVPEARNHIDMDACLEASVEAINDLNGRTQEFLAARLTEYLPISISAYIALPWLLQAITVAAVSGTDIEATEARKLDIFSRVLKQQEANFDGSKFCTDVLGDIIAYVRNEQRFVTWIAEWRQNRESDGYWMTVDSPKTHHNNIKLNWSNLIRTRPKLYLRLLLHLDFALCNGRNPQDEDLLWIR